MATEYLFMEFLLEYREYFEETEACTEEDVTEIEEKWGVKFPRSYREIYLILGESYGFNLIDDDGNQFENYEEIKTSAEELLASCKIKTDFVLDENMFVFGCFISNMIFYFFKLDEGDDPPVYRYQAGDKEYKLAAESLSLFIQKQSWYKGYLVLKEYKKSGKI
jgi:hypothetical protein